MDLTTLSYVFHSKISTLTLVFVLKFWLLSSLMVSHTLAFYLSNLLFGFLDELRSLIKTKFKIPAINGVKMG